MGTSYLPDEVDPRGAVSVDVRERAAQVGRYPDETPSYMTYDENPAKAWALVAGTASFTAYLDNAPAVKIADDMQLPLEGDGYVYTGAEGKYGAALATPTFSRSPTKPNQSVPISGPAIQVNMSRQTTKAGYTSSTDDLAAMILSGDTQW